MSGTFTTVVILGVGRIILQAHKEKIERLEWPYIGQTKEMRANAVVQARIAQADKNRHVRRTGTVQPARLS